MENQEKKKIQVENNDVEMTTLLDLFVRGFRSIGRGIKTVATVLTHFAIGIIIFLKRKILWIVAAFAIGYGVGAYSSYRNGIKFQASMTVRANFGSSRALYNAADYLNALIGGGKYKELSTLLLVTEAEAASLNYFEILPVEDEISVSQLYKEQFFQFDRAMKVRTDTFWTRTIAYKDFKESLTKYDYPLQEVTAVSTSSDIFPKLQEGLVKIVSANTALKKNYDINKKTQQDEEHIIMTSLSGLDTLRQVYNERLRNKSAAGETGPTNLTVVDKVTTTPSPELELYDKLLILKDELKSVRDNSSIGQEIVQVYAPFNPVGKKVSLLRQNSISYAYSFAGLALIILLVIELFGIINTYEREKKIVNSKPE